MARSWHEISKRLFREYTPANRHRRRDLVTGPTVAVGATWRQNVDTPPGEYASHHVRRVSPTWTLQIDSTSWEYHHAHTQMLHQAILPSRFEICTWWSQTSSQLSSVVAIVKHTGEIGCCVACEVGCSGGMPCDNTAKDTRRHEDKNETKTKLFDTPSLTYQVSADRHAAQLGLQA